MDYISDIQKEKIMNALTEKRRIHTRGVRETGKKLSKIYGADAEKVDIACVFHDQLRSEERRVGKECRSRWSPYH